MYRMATTYSRGFTLVEMLVVIIIIFILLSIVIAAGSQARANARDKSRVNDINAIALAFQLEKEVNDYPSGSGEIGTGANGTLDSIVSSRIGNLPVDPRASSASYGYFYSATLCGGEPGVYIQAFETGFDAEGDCDGTYPYTVRLP